MLHQLAHVFEIECEDISIGFVPLCPGLCEYLNWEQVDGMSLLSCFMHSECFANPSAMSSLYSRI